MLKRKSLSSRFFLNSQSSNYYFFNIKNSEYFRGAELTWQGRPSEGELVALKTIAADKVTCTGKERSLIDCQIEKGTFYFSVFYLLLFLI